MHEKKTITIPLDESKIAEQQVYLDKGISAIDEE